MKKKPSRKNATKSEVRNAAAILGSKGGKKGVKNPRKARTSEKARAAAQVRWAKHRAKQAERTGAGVADPATS